jgi:hypothetical protein
MNCAVVLLVYGLGGIVGVPQPFTGMDSIELELRRIKNVQVRAFRHNEDALMLAYAKTWALKCHIVFVAQSAGGNGALRVAQELDEAALPVKLVIAFDPPDRTMTGYPLPPVPGNIESLVNYRQDGGLGGGTARREDGNKLTAYVANKNVGGFHVPMPRRFVGNVIKDVQHILRSK